MKIRTTLAIAASTLMLASAANAQVNVMGTPTYGTYTVNSGFTPDPISYAVVAGGNQQASAAAPGCNAGWIANVPDVRVHYTAGTFPLRFYVDAPGTDTTLAVNDPGGMWHCNDDTVGLQPVIDFASPVSGQYDIFVGTFTQNSYPEVQLYVTELPGSFGPSGGMAPQGQGQGQWGQGQGQIGQAAGGPDWSGEPTYGTYTVNSGFTPDPISYQVTAGGTAQASLVSTAQGMPCNAGWVATTPDIRVHYTSGTFPLRFFVDTPGTDTTLAVNAPDGQWYCNDDTVGLHPVIDFAQPLSGQYDVFVGTFAQGAYPNVTLKVTELPASYGPQY
jgi:hypothetical protein